MINVTIALNNIDNDSDNSNDNDDDDDDDDDDIGDHTKDAEAHRFNISAKNQKVQK